jgi:hypothetical protein
MIIRLRSEQFEQRLRWIEENISPRKFYLHTMQGGQGWTYYAQLKTIVIEDEQLQLLYILRWENE